MRTKPTTSEGANVLALDGNECRAVAYAAQSEWLSVRDDDTCPPLDDLRTMHSKVGGMIRMHEAAQNGVLVIDPVVAAILADCAEGLAALQDHYPLRLDSTPAFIAEYADDQALLDACRRIVERANGRPS